MRGLLLHQTFPGANTAIVVGSLADVAPPPDLSRYRAVLWCVHQRAATPPPAGIAPDRLHSVIVEQLDPAAFAATLEKFVRLHHRVLPDLMVSETIGGAAAQAYDIAISGIHAILESTQRTRVTRQKDGFTWQRHILQNVPAYVRARVPETWAAALRGRPAFVVGAGPSLDVSLPTLAAHAGRAVIFSADSALRALARHGITADFAVSIDAAKVPDKCLAPTGPTPARVVLASVSPPAWAQTQPAGHPYFLSGHQLTDDWLATLGVARTPITVAESCGSSAIELAYFLGCDPICLFGLDLAVDPQNQAQRHQQHADPALYTQSNYDPSVQLPRVPGNYAETVPSFAIGDWRDLDARLAARSGVTILNVTDRGARLRGTTVVHPSAFTLDAPLLDKSGVLAALAPAASTVPEAVLAHLHSVGTRCSAALPDLRRALDRGGPAALAEAFRPLILDAETGRALGAFALKLMPHLVPPIEDDRAHWQNLLDEFAALAALARDAR